MIAAGPAAGSAHFRGRTKSELMFQSARSCAGSRSSEARARDLVAELRCQTLPERDLDCAVMSLRWVGRKEEGS